MTTVSSAQIFAKAAAGRPNLHTFTATGKPGYSPRNAVGCAALAEAAYLPPDEFKKLAAGLGFNDVRFHNVGDSQAYVAVRDDLVVVAFRGSEPNRLGDWVDDAKVLQKTPFTGEAGQPAGLVHRGFEQALGRVWNGPVGISAELTKLSAERPARALLVTGHSLGAAMAGLASAQMFKEKLPNAGTYVFGSPLIGDGEFKTWFEKNISNYYPHQHQNDAVTRVPTVLKWEPIGTKELRYITGTNEVVVGPSYMGKLPDRLLGRLDSFVPKAEKALEYGIGHINAAAGAVAGVAKKVVAAETGHALRADEMSFKEIWETDGLRDHNMDSYRKAVTIANIEDKP